MENPRPTPIRILHLCEHFGNRSASFHGVARSFELWLPYLDRPPFRVLLCSRSKPGAAALERFRKIGVKPIWLGYGKLDPRNLWRLIRLIRREHIDILHLHGYGACTWGRIAGHLLGIPAIVHERCNYHSVPWFQRPVEWVLGPFTRYAYAVSESTRQFTVRKRHIPDARVKLLYSGIPLDTVPRLGADERRAIRRTHGVGDADFLLGVVSRLEPHKGHADLLHAFGKVRAALPGTRLWIIGDGYHQAALEQLSRTLGLADAIDFLGYQADVWPLIQALDLQVFPSHQEGTPNTLYEAMAVGNAILASTADGQGEILTNGKDALLFAPGDLTALEQGLLRLYKDSALRAQLRRAALQRVADFDMQKTIATLKSAYLAIMGKA
ncbi:MAG: glycosyltransferase [Kiritimatiellae bacterium]|nr:glycosyltransferase [Kiritimatiellia bacterium]